MARPSASRTMGQTTISHVHVEVAHHLAQHGDLRRIFLAEVGAVRPDNLKQLADHGRHAAKVSGARAAIEPAQRSSTSTKVFAPAGYISCTVGANSRSTPSSSSSAASRSRVRGYFVKIFGRPELQWINEDRDRDRRRIALGGPHQRQVPFMQGAHGRHQSQSSCRCALNPRQAVFISAMVSIWRKASLVPRIWMGCGFADAGFAGWGVGVGAARQSPGGICRTRQRPALDDAREHRLHARATKPARTSTPPSKSPIRALR